VLYGLGRKTQILVIGSSGTHCTELECQLAYEVGCEVARHNAALVTGGLGGVMESACRGAKENGGLTVGIIPQDDAKNANMYCDIVVPTGLGWSRDFLTAYSADAVIAIGGGAGTAVETYVAYMKSKPIVVLEGSGGFVDSLSESYLDNRKLVKIIKEKDARRAVERALERLKQNQ
jgi:uncharacterized protein (TIGR00725 family)